MPKIPIIRPPEYRDRTSGLGDGPEPLSPEQEGALNALRARTARIDREVAVSRAWRAGVEGLIEAEKTPGGAPVGFARSFLDDLDRERARLVTSLPPAGREALERDLLDLRADFLDRAAQAEASGMTLRRRMGLYDALDGYVAGVRRDPGRLDRAFGRMDSLIGGMGLPEARQDPMRLYVKDVLGNAAVDALMEEPERAARALSNGLYDDMLSAPSKAGRLREAQDKVARETHLNRERAVANLAAQAHDGTASDEAILDAEHRHTLSPAESAYLRRVNAAASEAAARRDARIRRVAVAPERFDPTDPEDRAAVSAYWESIAEVYVSDDPKLQRENELRFVERVGVLPDGLETKYWGALYSRDPAVVVQGSTAIARLASRDPALIHGIPAEEVRRAQAIAIYASLGVEPDVAVGHADEKLAAENAQTTGSTRPGEYQVASADEPPVMSDAAAPGGADEETGIQPDGSAVLVDPETVERITIHPEDVARLELFMQDVATLKDLEDDFLRYYVLFKEGKISRVDATNNLRFLLNYARQNISESDELHNTLWRISDDIFDSPSFGSAEHAVINSFMVPGRQNEIGNLLLSIIPIVGSAYSAVEAYKGFEAAIEAWRRGDTTVALRESGMATLSAVGTVPGIGEIPRLARVGSKSFRIIKEFIKIVGRRNQFSSRGAMRRRNFDKSGDTPNESANKLYIDEPMYLDKYRAIERIKRIGQKRGSSVKAKKEWSNMYGHDWPIDPKTGRKLEGHHPDPLGNGGIQHPSNYIPMTEWDHKNVHREHGDSKRWGGRGKKK